VNFTYQYDWLANQTEWTDDQSAFYERSLGTNILNGHEATSSTGTGRPAALYLASNLPTSTATGMPSIDRGGWVSLEYGESGNVLSMTARGQCHDVSASVVCIDDPIETDPEQRGDDLATGCACDVEHHYQYRWDELNRLAEARRYDRGSGLGTWELQVRQRYRYDGANVRMIKETDDAMSGSLLPARTALYVYPGDFERRGLLNDGLEYLATMPDGMGGTYDLGAETQYLIAGARLTWKEFGVPGASGTGFDKEARLTYAVPDLIQSTSAVIDLYSGQLVEEATYYPNGARETLRTERGEGFSLEPMGFTGKEGDDEVGLVYFGERYLIPHLGRWATPDPLQVHAGGGGEFGNSYHYVSGNLLDARDPLGLDAEGLYRLLVDDGTYDLSESKRERLVFNAGSSRPGEGNLTQTREGRKAKLIVPSSNSGATAGWGYDGASRSAGEIRRQMQNARVNGPATGAMAAAAGLRGADAERSLGPMAQRPEVSYDEADRLFFQEVRPGYETMARNRFSITGGRWNALDPSVREALVDVVYNWNAVADDTHREMRTVMSNQNLSTIQQLEGLRDAHAAGRDRAGNPVFTRMNAYATVFLQSRIEEIESDQMFDETIDHYRSLPMEDAPDAPEPMPEP